MLNNNALQISLQRSKIDYIKEGTCDSLNCDGPIRVVLNLDVFPCSHDQTDDKSRHAEAVQVVTVTGSDRSKHIPRKELLHKLNQ